MRGKLRDKRVEKRDNFKRELMERRRINKRDNRNLTWLNQQLNQLESQMGRSSVTKPHTSSAVNAPLPSRAARLPSERKRPIRANYHRPKQGTALKAR